MAVETRLVFKVTDKASGSIKKLTTSMGALSKTVLKFGAGLTAITATAGVGTLAVLSKRVIDSTTELKRWGDRLGESIKDLSELRLVASQGGVSMERFTDFIKDFNIRMGEATQETGAAREMFDLLGVSAADFMKLPLTERIAQFADAVKRAGKDVGTLALDIGLSDPGVEVLNILRQGGGAVRGTAARMGQIGGSRSAGDLRQLEKFNQSIDTLTTMIMNLVEKFTIAVAPALEELVKKLSGSLERSGIFKPGNFEYLIYLIEQLVTKVIPEIGENLMRHMDNFKVGAAGIVQSIQDLKLSFDVGWAGLKALVSGGSKAFFASEAVKKSQAGGIPQSSAGFLDSIASLQSLQSRSDFIAAGNFGAVADVPSTQRVQGTDRGFLAGFKQGIGQIKTEWNKLYGTMALKGKAMAETTAKAMSSSFETFFFDVIEGRMTKLSEIFANFFKQIAKQIASVLSNRLAMNLIGGAVGMFGGAKFSGAFDSSGGVPVAPSGSASPVFGQGTSGLGRGKATTVEVVNQSGQPVEGQTAYVREDPGRTIIGVVLNAVNNNTMGSRDVLRGALA